MSKGLMCQVKIRNLEKNIVSLLDRVHGSTDTPHRADLDFNETKRKRKPDGFYFFTVQETGNESHGIIIEKKTVRNKASFFLFDPNGKHWANHTAYHVMISHDGKSLEPSVSISPDNSWNPMGYCGLWCIVVAVFLSNVSSSRDDKRVFPNTAIDKFYSYMDTHGTEFIEDIYQNMVLRYRGEYDSRSECRIFIDAVVGKILLALS